MADHEIKDWTKSVEDLVNKGDINGAISLLESVVSNLETLTISSSESNNLLSDLQNLQSSKNLSLNKPDGPRKSDSHREENSNASSSNQDRDDDEDWESIADFKGTLLDSVRVDEVSESRRRRGRGSFLYMKDELYCDRLDDYNSSSEDEDESGTVRNSNYGTGHVIVLYDFPPSTRTTQLEIVFDKFRELGFVIRWVNDTVALAVFRTPSAANEALSGIHFPFKVRRLDEDDAILTQISTKDLEPPIVRPKTSARTAQRLIAHAMGIEPSNSPGSDEFRKQEEARKNRIHERQNMMNDAWGSD